MHHCWWLLTRTLGFATGGNPAPVCGMRTRGSTNHCAVLERAGAGERVICHGHREQVWLGALSVGELCTPTERTRGTVWGLKQGSHGGVGGRQ